jgi:hypothetical protein
MSWLFNIGQEVRLHSAQKEAEKASEKTIDLSANADTLKRRLDVMALANQALFEILQSRLGIAEEEVILRMAEIDARDGKKDGKISPRVVACMRCGKKVSTSRLRCMFCNETVTDGHLFEKS